MSELQALMRELEARDAREREAGLPSSQRMRALVPEAGQFIAIVIRAMRAMRILEIGTSYGYSGLWLGSAAQAHEGHVDTIELNAERYTAAGEHFRRAGLGDTIRQYQGDAHQVLATLGSDYDFIFIDAEKDDYEDYLDLTLGKVERGGIIMADNVLSHADQLQQYSEKAQHMPGLLSVTVPVGRGEEMSLRVDDGGVPPEVVVALAGLELYARAHKGTTGPSRTVGKFLYILVRAVRAQAALDVGGSTGTAGLWLGAAMKASGGKAVSVEGDAAQVKVANETFAKAKLANQISMRAGKGPEALAALEAPFDFVYVDAARVDYAACAAALWPKLKPNGLMVANNVKGASLAREGALSVRLPMGTEMELTLKGS